MPKAIISFLDGIGGDGPVGGGVYQETRSIFRIRTVSRLDREINPCLRLCEWVHMGVGMGRSIGCVVVIATVNATQMESNWTRTVAGPPG